MSEWEESGKSPCMMTESGIIMEGGEEWGSSWRMEESGDHHGEWRRMGIIKEGGGEWVSWRIRESGESPWKMRLLDSIVDLDWLWWKPKRIVMSPVIVTLIQKKKK